MAAKTRGPEPELEPVELEPVDERGSEPEVVPDYAPILPRVGEGIFVAVDGGGYWPAVVTHVYPGDPTHLDLTAFPRSNPPVPLTAVELVDDHDRARGVRGRHAAFWEPDDQG